jgi:hypothetical protein
VSKEQMYFMIKLSPAYGGFLEEKKMDWRDLEGIMRNHASRHTKNPVRFAYLRPDQLQKIDPLGQNGYIWWGEERDYSKQAKEPYFDHHFKGGVYTKKMATFCNPPHLKEDFPFKAIGIPMAFLKKADEYEKV